MLERLITAVFGCTHSNISRAWTPRQTKSVFVTKTQVGTYVACLDCGRELPYDWQRMKVAGKAAPLPVIAADPVISDGEEFAR